MGFFSWLDCKTGKPIYAGTKEVYVLLPEKLKKHYGCSKLVKSHYDGMGMFGSTDVHELIAEMNREELSSEMLEEVPKLEDYGGLWSYEKEALKCDGLSAEEIEEADRKAQKQHYMLACNIHSQYVKMLHDYKNHKSHKYMTSVYGSEYLREIGIAISSYDEQMKKLPYPLKVTYDATATYEDCGPSLRDPGQGCY